MNKKQIIEKLNSFLQPINCRDCPLTNVCNIYVNAGNDCICLMLEDKIKNEREG